MVLRWIGRTLIAVGTLILLFLAYQLFGTNFVTSRSQAQLRAHFFTGAKTPIPNRTATLFTGGPGVSPTATPPAEAPRVKPDLGTGVALIEIPKIDLSAIVVEGVDVPDLKKGPGHYPGTPLPGNSGNVVISGHRTTYGHPFYNLNELSAGDPIYLTDPDGEKFTYVVDHNDIVAPTAVQVVSNTKDDRLTLTTCNPRFSAAQRLIVVAKLQGPTPAQPIS